MSKVCPLFSSSAGNSTFICGSTGGILVDTGVSGKSIFSALEKIQIDYTEIKAVLITHEHIDHIKGLSPFLKKSGAKLIASKETLSALYNLNKIPEKIRVEEISDKELEVNGMAISRFSVSHDCDGTSGYTITLPDQHRVTVCTDLGFVSDEVRIAINNCNTVVLESNHDLDMLKKGPYPPELKMRIMSEKGHLSNNSCAAELKIMLENGVTRFVLAHLSEHNNMPVLAKNCAVAALADISAKEGIDYILSVAKPSDNGVILI